MSINFHCRFISSLTHWIVFQRVQWQKNRAILVPHPRLPKSSQLCKTKKKLKLQEGNLTIRDNKCQKSVCATMLNLATGDICQSYQNEHFYSNSSFPCRITKNHLVLSSWDYFWSLGFIIGKGPFFRFYTILKA